MDALAETNKFHLFHISLLMFETKLHALVCD